MATPMGHDGGYPKGGHPHPQGDEWARRAADRAYAKALRPWYKKKRFIIPIALIGLFFLMSACAAIIGGSDAGDSDGSTTSGGDSATPTAAPPPAGPAFGTVVRGDKLDVTVNPVGPCLAGASSCTFEVRYANTSSVNQDEFVSTDDMILVDTQNRRFESTAFDAIDLQPSGTKNTQITFQGMPPDFTPSRIEVSTGGAEFAIAIIP